MTAGSAAYILDAVRTPIARARGALSGVRPDDLAAEIIGALLKRQPALRERVDHVVFGAANQAGEDHHNVARTAVLLSGLGYELSAVTVNRTCASGLEAVADAARRIIAGEADAVIAGGVESVTRAPFTMAKAEQAFGREPPVLYDTTASQNFPNPQLADRFDPTGIGAAQENIAKRYGISRDEQDHFALQSHSKATAAWEAARFAAEVHPITIEPGGATARFFERDQAIKPALSLAELSELPPVYRPGGSVTRGNSAPLGDAAAAALVVSEAVLSELESAHPVRLMASATAGVDPSLAGEGALAATKRVLARAGIRAPNVSVIELDEAFAVQALACSRGLDLDPDRINPLGGAIALGHPVGASGARMVATLYHQMCADPALRLGLVAASAEGGQGVALLIEQV